MPDQSELAPLPGSASEMSKLVARLLIHLADTSFTGMMAMASMLFTPLSLEELDGHTCVVV